MNSLRKLLLTFYGDDFTGSTDALEFITRAGAKAILFTEMPTEEQLAAHPGLDAWGVAGKTRALPPAKMEEELKPAFEQMLKHRPRHVHYKVCSTFDSSPELGSIGKAIDCGAAVFQNNFIPVLGGMPALGRYCLFGNLFARMGIGSQGAIYRLDRHPSMNKHPVTPATESDLTRVLAAQTQKKTGLVDILKITGSRGDLDQALEVALENKAEVIVLDALTNDDLFTIGELLEDTAIRAGKTLFSAGSSGIELGLGSYWNRNHVLNPVIEWPYPGKAEPLLVISGSCSPVTQNQIAVAKANGFDEIVLDAHRVCNGETPDDTLLTDIYNRLRDKKNLVLHTGTKQDGVLPPEKLGTALGHMAKNAVLSAAVKRVLVAGGDTSSYAARAMEIDAVEMIAPLVSGAPLCRVWSANPELQGLEVNFKGGQVGTPNYFLRVLGGK